MIGDILRTGGAQESVGRLQLRFLLSVGSSPVTQRRPEPPVTA